MQDLAAKSCNKPVPRLRGAGPGDSGDCRISQDGRAKPGGGTQVLLPSRWRQLPRAAAAPEKRGQAQFSAAQGVKDEIDEWYREKIGPIKDVLAETEEEEEEEEEGWLEKFFRELWGEKKPKKEPKSKYLGYVTKVAQAGPKGYLSGGDDKETKLKMELRRLQPAQAVFSEHHEEQGGFAPLVLRLLRPRRDRGGPASCRLHVVWTLCNLAQRPQRKNGERLSKKSVRISARRSSSLATVQVFVVFLPTRPGAARRHL